MKLLILTKNKYLNIDKSKENLIDFKNLMLDEVCEVEDAILDIYALKEDTTDHVVEEILDVIQVCINQLYNMNIDIEQAFATHKDKLLGRGWEYSKVLEISEAEHENR